MGKRYSEELDQFACTALWAGDQDVTLLRRYLDRLTGDFLAVVGSGGSYSAAVVTALLRELETASATSAVTPLQFVSLSARLPDARAFLISAEGKNRDILHVAKRAIASDHSVGALTLTTSSPLMDVAESTRAMRVFAYQMPWGKDGYLATNSLLATVLLFYKAFRGETAMAELLEGMLKAESVAKRRSDLRILSTRLANPSHGVLILYGEGAKPFSIDLESKLSESAVALTSMVDLRQFAHGRHLQLADERAQPFVIVAYNKSEKALAKATLAQFPLGVQLIEVPLTGKDAAEQAIEGILESSYLMECLASGLPHDIGDPPVGEFGRAIHKLDPDTLTDSPPLMDYLRIGGLRKLPVTRRDAESQQLIHRAGNEYVERLEQARIKAIICDFDGTLCRAENRYQGIDPAILKRLVELADQGLVIAIASGRGDSLHEDLKKALPQRLRSRVLVGLYSGTYILRVDEEYVKPAPAPEFQALLEWLSGTAFARHNASMDKVKGGQLSLLVSSPRDAKRLHAAIAAWLRARNLTSWRTYRSGHSVDVLDSVTSKLRVIETVARVENLSSSTEILCIGDCGQEEGNDYELLQHPLSLSVDGVSVELDRCWNFARAGCSQAAATLEYLEALSPHKGGGFQICLRKVFESIDQKIEGESTS